MADNDPRDLLKRVERAQTVAGVLTEVSFREWPLEWKPEGGTPLESLQILATQLNLRQAMGGVTESVIPPADVLAAKGGDWDDIAILLGAAAYRLDLTSRFCVIPEVEDGRTSMQLQLQVQVGSKWFAVGERGILDLGR